MKYHEFARGTVYRKPQWFNTPIGSFLSIVVRVYLKCREHLMRYMIWGMNNSRFICGENCYISENSSYIVEKGKSKIEFGDNVICRGMLSAFGEAHICVGNNVHIGDDTIICARKGIMIGNNVQIANNVVIFDNNIHSIDYVGRQDEFSAVMSNLTGNHYPIKNRSDIVGSTVNIGDDVWIGLNCIIMKGVTIGQGAIIAAGSIVTKDVRPFSLMAGPTVNLKKSVDFHNGV